MRKFNVLCTTKVYEKYGYPEAELIFRDCSYNSACAGIERLFNPQKIKTKALDVNKGIKLLETNKGNFIIDEFYTDKSFLPNESGIVCKVGERL